MSLVGGYIMTDYPMANSDKTQTNLKSFSFVLIDKSYGAMLFDTGSPTQQDVMVNELKNKFSLDLKDIKWVFNTHLHIDHVGINALLPHVNTVLSKKEYEFILKLVDAAFSNINFLDFMLENCPGYKGLFTQYEADILKEQVKQYYPGDEAMSKLNIKYIEDCPEIPHYISILPSHGHTFDHYSFKIETSNIDFYIVGDSISNRLDYYADYEQPTEPQADIQQYIDTIAEASNKYEGIIVPGHDRPFFSNSFKSVKENIFNINEICPGKTKEAIISL